MLNSCMPGNKQGLTDSEVKHKHKVRCLIKSYYDFSQSSQLPQRRGMSRNIGSGGNRGGETHSDRDSNLRPPLPPLPPDRLRVSSNTDAPHQNSNPTQPESRQEGFIEYTFRLTCGTPARENSSEPKEFMRGLLNKVEKIVKFRILNPFPADARPELMKKSQTPVPTIKCSEQNDIKLFSNLFHS